VSKSGLVLDVSQAEQPGRLLEEVALLVRVLRATQEADRVRPIDRNFLVVDLLGGDPGRIARLPNLLRDPLDRVVPGDLFPVVAAGRTVAGRREPVRGGVCREHGNALDAQRSSIHDVVVVAFHRNQPAFANGRDHSAPTRAEVARCGELTHVRELKFVCRSPYSRNVDKAAECKPYAPTNGHLQPISAIDWRWTLCLWRTRQLTVSLAFLPLILGTRHR
jgi:hypothetical protein